MKKFLSLAVLLMAVSTLSYSQSVSLSVISSQGNIDKNEYLTIEWTIGESFVETVRQSHIILTQGFQQTFDQKNLRMSHPLLSFNIFPNPTATDFNISLNTSDHDLFMLSLYDIHGRMLQQVKLNQGFRTTHINMAGLSAGLYLLKITDNGGFNVESHKIIKL